MVHSATKKSSVSNCHGFVFQKHASNDLFKNASAEAYDSKMQKKINTSNQITRVFQHLNDIRIISFIIFRLFW